MSVDVDSRPLDCWMKPLGLRHRWLSGLDKFLLQTYIDSSIVPKDDSAE